MIKSKNIKCLSAALTVTALSLLVLGSAHAEQKGTGTEEDPYTTDEVLAVGDSIPVGGYVQNLIPKDEAEISAKRNYEANSYEITVDTGEGSFPDESSGSAFTITYGELLYDALPGEWKNPPTLEGSTFSGWLLRGNRVYAGKRNGLHTAGDFGDIIVDEGVRYLIALEDEEDRLAADIDEKGRVVMKALWRKDSLPVEDSWGATTEPGEENGEDTDDWDPLSTSLSAVEYIPSCEDAESYATLHGPVRYQYGRVRLSAETTDATSYSWYIKKKDTPDYVLIENDSPEYYPEMLTRADDGALVRCVVSFGEGEGSFLTYETKITVYYLPAIETTHIEVNGREVSL